MALTKIDLVEKICSEIGLTKKEGMTIMDSLFDIIKDELSRGNPVKISRFGKWIVKSKRARVGRNPQTGETIKIDARKVVTFKGSNVMRDSVNSSN